jgi:methionyl-tRNA formyltransferase
MVTAATQTETGAPVPPLRIVFFGTPAFAVPSLDALLLASPHTVVGVVTQPDRPRGRGHKLSDAPVKARAVDAGLPVLQPERMKDQAFLDALAAWGADLGVVAAYGRILTDAILATPRLGMINVHASLLPRYRGAAPVHRAVIAGETSTGVTIMRVVTALDAGAMFVKEHRPIAPDETSDEVERALAQIGARLLVGVVDQIARGHAVETPQNDAESTYAHRLTREDGAIDWSWPAARVHNLIRGLHPWPHAFSFVQGKRVIVRRSAVEAAGSGAPGTILEADGDRLIVATGEDTLRILEMQAEGKRPMTAREFLAGHRLTVGDRFAEMVRLPPSPSDGVGGTSKPDTTDAP